MPVYMRGRALLAMIRSAVHYFHIILEFAPQLARSLQGVYDELGEFLRVHFPMSPVEFQAFAYDVRLSFTSFTNF